MAFTATTNNTGENGDKKQNTLPYPYNFKVVEVCLVGAGDGKCLHFLWRNECAKSRDERLAPTRKTHHNGCVFLVGAGDESRTRRNQLGKLTPYR